MMALITRWSPLAVPCRGKGHHNVRSPDAALQHLIHYGAGHGRCMGGAAGGEWDGL